MASNPVNGVANSTPTQTNPGWNADGNYFRQGFPVHQHFSGPTSQFINVFSQPGNYTIAINVDGSTGARQNPLQRAGGIRGPLLSPIANVGQRLSHGEGAEN